jgi:glycosyltransferase involved in cell wall biosynthesis
MTAASSGPHVLVVASTFPAGPADTVPRFVYDQVIALARVRPQWRFTVLAPHDGRSVTADRTEHDAFTERRFHYLRPRRWQSLAGHGIMPAIRSNPLQILAVPALLWGEYRAIRSMVRQERPDIVYAHWFTPQAVCAAPVAARARIPLVFTTHASDVAVWGRFGGVGRALVSAVTRRAGRFTAVSETSMLRMKPFFDEAGWARVRERAQVIPMGVELTTGTVADDLGRASRGRRTVLFMGRLAEKKGVRFLLEAFATVQASMPDVDLVVAGDGPLRADLEARSRRLGLQDRVSFVGYRSGHAKDELYRRADVCVLPSIVTDDGDAEGLPVALLEALAYGVPTIASEASNAGEVVDSGVDAVVCPAGDAAALGRALEDMLSWPAERRAAMSTAARRTAQRFDWNHVAEQTAQFLLDPFLGGHPAPDTSAE